MCSSAGGGNGNKNSNPNPNTHKLVTFCFGWEFTVTYISHHIHDEAAAPLSFALTRGTSSLVVVVVVVVTSP